MLSLSVIIAKRYFIAESKDLYLLSLGPGHPHARVHGLTTGKPLSTAH